MPDATYNLNGGFKPTMKRFADLGGPDFSQRQDGRRSLSLRTKNSRVIFGNALAEMARCPAFLKKQEMRF